MGCTSCTCKISSAHLAKRQSEILFCVFGSCARAHDNHAHAMSMQHIYAGSKVLAFSVFLVFCDLEADLVIRDSFYSCFLSLGQAMRAVRAYDNNQALAINKLFSSFMSFKSYLIDSKTEFD